MSKLSKVADRVLGQQTIKLDDIIKQYGGVVTINGLSFTKYKGSEIPTYTFVEGDGLNFFGGCKKLRELADALMEVYDGDLRAINTDFLKTGLRIRVFEQVKTASGNPFRPVAKIGYVDLTEDGGLEFDTETGEVVADKKVDKTADVPEATEADDDVPF